jgi:hypothetical protein
MAKASGIQESFAAGEISPLLYGRVGLPRYKEGLAICQNYIPLLQGPKTRRPGTSFVFPVKDSSAVTRLIPFSVSTTQNFMLEFGNEYIRFFKNYAPVTNATKAITAITAASPAVVSSNAHGFSNGDHVFISGILGMTELNNREFVITNKNANDYQLTDNITGVIVDASGFTAYISGGTAGVIYELTNAVDDIPYLTADLPKIQTAQSNDVLYIVHPSYQPATLTRVADNDWDWLPFDNLDGPYLDEDVGTAPATLTTLTATYHVLAPGNKWTLDANQVANINGGQGFLAGDVGRVVRVESASNWYWWQIASIVSTTSVFINDSSGATLDPSGINVATGTTFNDWRLGVWGSPGWPAAVTFHQDRLVFGGAAADPTRFDGSNSGDYTNFAPTAVSGTISASNSYGFSLSSQDLNSILWMSSDEQGLLIGTAESEWIVGAADATSALSALSVSAKKTTSQGSNPVQSVQLGKYTLFVQQGGRKLREMQYNFYATGYVANDLTQLSEHVTTGGITYLASQKTPQPIMWATRTDGTLLAMTYERDLESVKVGWSRHVMGGTLSDGSQAKVESVAVIPSADATTQDVWVIVQRYVNGHTVRYIEYITPFFDNDTAIEDAFFLDSGLTYDSTSTTTLSGLNHLNGQELSVIADGAKQTNKTPINGHITLDSAASKVTVGLAYNSDGQKLRSDGGAADGTAMGKTRRTHRIGIQMLNTAGFKLGPDFDTLDDISLDDTTSGVIGTTDGLFTGICTQPISTTYDFDNMICWRQSDPFPGTILGLYPQQETQDR